MWDGVGRVCEVMWEGCVGGVGKVCVGWGGKDGNGVHGVVVRVHARGRVIKERQEVWDKMGEMDEAMEGCTSWGGGKVKRCVEV